MAILLEAIAGIDWVIVIADLGGIEHQQFLSIITVQLLYLLGKSHLVYDLVVHHLFVTREEVYYGSLDTQLITV